MAVLAAADIDEIWARLMKRWPKLGLPPFAHLASEFRADIVAADAWADANAASYNAALSTKGKAMTARAKATLLQDVIQQRMLRTP
jgi:hypothetical protein